MKSKGSQFNLQSFDQPTQLPMFMPASEIRDNVTATADMPAHSPDDVYDMKLTDAMRPAAEGVHGAGVYDSVSKEGVKSPVQLIHGQEDIMLGQGHHRAASADFASSIEKKPYWTPVVHTDARQYDTSTLMGNDEVSTYDTARSSLVRDSAQFGRFTPSMGQDLAWNKHLESSMEREMMNSPAIKGFGLTAEERGRPRDGFARRPQF